MKDKKKIQDKDMGKNHIDEMEAFIKSKKEENKVLKKIIDKLNSMNNKNNKQ